MKRENRYIVFKQSDIDVCQDPIGLRQGLSYIASEIEQARTASGKPTLECVVVESDWPEHEGVWDMIERRVDGAPPLDVRLADIPTLNLLHEIVKREGTGPCPVETRYSGVWYDVVVGVGDDATASIRFADDAQAVFEALEAEPVEPASTVPMCNVVEEGTNRPCIFQKGHYCDCVFDRDELDDDDTAPM